MKIAIIGAGNTGATLARNLAASFHEVKLANSKGPETIRDLARVCLTLRAAWFDLRLRR